MVQRTKLSVMQLKNTLCLYSILCCYNCVSPPSEILYDPLLIWYPCAISPDFGTAGRSERFREFLLASAVIPACLSALYPRPKSERAWLSTPPYTHTHTQCNPFWSPLLFMLYWSKELPNPLPNPPPSPHTHKHHKPSKIAGTAQIGGAPWERGVTGSGVRQLQKRKKKGLKEGKKPLRKQSLWISLAAWVAVVLLHSERPPSPFTASESFPLWKLWHLL